jgi:trimeric autotransporter adhesin
MRLSGAYAALAAIGAASAAFACGGDGGTPPPSQVDNTPASISLSGIAAGDTLFSIGETKQLTATVRNAANQVISNPSVSYAVTAGGATASVTQAGAVTAIAGGANGTAATATIRATAGTVTADITVPVRQRLATLEITPGPTIGVGVGFKRTLSAAPRDARGNAIQGLPMSGLSFTSSNPAIAEVNSSTGVVTGRAVGTANITAQLSITSGGAQGSGAGTSAVTVAGSTASVATNDANNSFSPGVVTIVAGGSVTFTVGDLHNVDFESSAIADMLTFGQGGTRTFATAGTYKYRCQPHSVDFDNGMVGRVVVIDPGTP